MNLLRTFCILALVGTVADTQAAGPNSTGALATPANRIVGAWANESRVGTCPAGPLGPVLRQTLVFHAGGTFLDNSRFPPQGLPTPAGTLQRSIGVGTWSYDPNTGQHRLRQQFDFYLANTYDGYMVIERLMQLSNDGNTITGPVETTRYSAGGQVLGQQCGEAISTRL